MTATTAQLASHCVQTRYGRLYLALTVLGLLALAGITGAVLLSEQPGAGAVLLALAAALLVALVPLFRRAQFPLDVALTPQGLALTPVGRSVKLGVPAETLPLPGISGYSQTEQQSSLTLTLYLADGRTLVLTDKPRGLREPALEPGFVPLTALSAALQERLAQAGSGAQARPNFFQGVGGQVLAGICGVAFVAGVVLLFVPGVEWTHSIRLLAFSSIYLGMYLRNRKPR